MQHQIKSCYSFKLRLTGLIRKSKKNKSLKNVVHYKIKDLHAENPRVFKYYVRILALQIGDFLIHGVPHQIRPNYDF